MQSSPRYQPVFPTKSAPVGGESLKVDRPPSPQVEGNASETPEPSRLNGAQTPVGAKNAPTSSDSALSLVAAHTSPRLKSTDLPEMTPPSPRSYGLGAPSGPHPGEGSSMPQSKRQL
jgi:hypothetical protein